MQTHIISHTHWDREWYLTYEQFRLRLVGLIDRLLDMMESQPDYQYFHLDGQTIVLEDYLELRPHQEARLRKLIADGRILIGPWYDMPDEFLVSGESLIRNLARGHRLSLQFGTPMPVGYLPDLFGHVSQMPQILRNFGLDNAVLWRGFGGRRAEYWWQAPDGSRVLMMHLPSEGYCNATRVHLNPGLMMERATKAIQAEASRTAVGEVLLMNGVDHVEPHPVIPQLARQLTESLGTTVRQSTLPAYVDAVRTGVQQAAIGESLEVIHGELRGGEDYANLLPGVMSARVYLKQANTRVQTLLEKRAEPLATFAWMLGAVYPADELRYAWKTLLQNHPHDSICGCSIDPVHEENMTRFARAEQVGRAIVDQASRIIAHAVPGAGDGRLRLVAVNTSAEPFSGVIEATVDVPYETDEPRRVVDEQALDEPVRFWPKDARIVSVTASDGQRLPFQTLALDEARTMVMSRYETPWILRARRRRFVWLGEVPALGWATFDIELSEQSPDMHSTNAYAPRHVAAAILVTARSAENAFVRMTVNDDGTVTVVDKRSGTTYARCGELEDVGDVGDDMQTYSPPEADRRITSADATNVHITTVHPGPLRATFRIDVTLALPGSASHDRKARTLETVPARVSTLVTLNADSSRLDWHVAVDNQAKDHRLRLLFPTGADAVTEVRAETAFGVARRPAARERPAEVRMEVPVNYGPTGSFTEAGSAKAGATVFGEGLHEYEAVAGDDGRISKLALTLLRCVGYLSREDLVLRPSGHAGPGVETPGAQCPGHHEFRLGFEPRGDSPTNASLFARAAAFMTPAHVVPVGAAKGKIPAAGSFVEIVPAAGEVVLSACHKAEDQGALILRLFNPDDAPATIQITMRRKIKHAHRVDFLERASGAVTVEGDEVETGVPAHGIVTLEIG